MKFILTAISIMFAPSFQEPRQQPQTITITVTIPKAELILKGLSKLPYEESAELIQDISMQAQKQLQPKVDSTGKPKKQ